MSAKESLATAAAPGAEVREDDDKLRTPEQIAERWGVPKTQVYRLAREGKVPHVRLGKYVRFNIGEIRAFERDGGVE